jgi:hypothetical protein
MSAVWSLSGVKRTSQFKNGISVCDPRETSSADSLRREFTVRIFDLDHMQASTKSSILAANVNSRRIRVRA